MRLAERVVAEAEMWLGTPYQHGQSLKAVGTDCLGLVRGIWRALYGHEPFEVPPYSPDWAEISAGEPLIEGLGAHMARRDVEEAMPSDVLVFRMRQTAAAKHLAVLVSGQGVSDPEARIIHAYWGRAVVRSWLRPLWSKHLVAAFGFPESIKESKTPTTTSRQQAGFVRSPAT